MKYIKLFLFGGIFTLVGVFNFSSAETVEDLLDINIHTLSNISVSGNYTRHTVVDFGDIGLKNICVKFYNISPDVNIRVAPFLQVDPSTISRDSYFYYWSSWEGSYSCFYAGEDYHYLNIAVPNDTTLDVDYFYMDTFLSSSIPLMSSTDCQNEYNLIPISSIDTGYCVENDLCPISGGSRSELVINDIAHEGKPLINIMIPDYIQRDYTGNENQYDIYVGSGYDQDYIDSILKINSYRPDNEDFTQIFVSGLTLIFPYIFVALLIVFIWKLLKRVFK